MLDVSIRWRLLLAMNLLIVAMGVAAGWAGARVAGQIVERRLLDQVAQDTSRFLANRSLPITDALMDDLSSMFAVQFVAVRDPGGDLLGSSLGDVEEERFLRAIAEGTRAGQLRYGEGDRFASHPTTIPSIRSGDLTPVRLYVIAPATLYAQAREQAAREVGKLAIFGMVTLSLVTILLTVSITRPIGRLADEMDDIATNVAQSHPVEHARSGPAELARLSDSFHRLLARLEQAQEELGRQTQLAALGTMAAGVAHELRNPLSGIAMHLRLLSDEVDAPERFDTLQREIQRMDLVIQELLSLATSGDAESDIALNPSPVNLSALVESVAVLLESKATHAGVTIARTCADAPEGFLADADCLRQVIMNLLINAMEATDDGGTVTVSTMRTDNGVRCEIADFGPGVPSDAGDIFEPFVSTKPKGAGLGLYVSKKIIVAHGGQIGYRNDETGATFWFELPVKVDT